MHVLSRKIIIVLACVMFCLGMLYLGAMSYFFTTPHNCCTQHDSDDTQSLPPVHLNVPTRVSTAPAHYAHYTHHYPAVVAASVSYYERVRWIHVVSHYNMQHLLVINGLLQHK